MTDLVKRLRAPPLAERNEGIKIEAADEIERLTDEIERLGFDNETLRGALRILAGGEAKS